LFHTIAETQIAKRLFHNQSLAEDILLIPFRRGPIGLVLLILTVAAGAAVASDKKKDPVEIGSRDVGGGVNFYWLEKEIALGKEMAQEVKRQARITDDPVLAEYVNRLDRTWPATPTPKCRLRSR
jgi:hypothetical protein